VAAVGYSDAQVRAAVKSVATQLNLEDSDITITPSTRQKFDPVTVKVQTELPLIVPIISGLLQNPFPVSGQATMMMEK